MKLLLVLLMISSTAFGSDTIKKGRDLYKQCVSCHGESAVSTNEYIPNLACQKEGYLIRQFFNFKSWKRAHSTMSEVSKELSLKDMKNLSAYLNSFKRCSYEPEVDLETMCSERADKQACITCCFKFDTIEEINKCTRTCDAQLLWIPINSKDSMFYRKLNQ